MGAVDSGEVVGAASGSEVESTPAAALPVACAVAGALLLGGLIACVFVIESMVELLYVTGSFDLPTRAVLRRFAVRLGVDLAVAALGAGWLLTIRRRRRPWPASSAWLAGAALGGLSLAMALRVLAMVLLPLRDAL